MSEQLDMLSLAGALVDRAIKGRGWTKGNAALRVGISDPTLRLMIRGQKVSDHFYGKAESALDLPPGLLTALVEGDSTLAGQLGTELPPNLRATLTPLLPQNQRRRKTDAGS